MLQVFKVFSYLNNFDNKKEGERKKDDNQEEGEDGEKVSANTRC